MDSSEAMEYVREDALLEGKFLLGQSYETASTASERDETEEAIVAARFNQDSTCLAVTARDGFGIYNCNPFSWACDRNLTNKAHGGIHAVEMMYRCNIIAIVGASPFDPNDTASDGSGVIHWHRNVLILWDDKKGSEVAQLVFGGPIKNVRLLRKIMAIVLQNVVYVYTLENVELIETIKTGPNPQGLCAVATNGNLNVVAYPQLEPGSVGIQLFHLNPVTDAVEASESQVIRAHRSELCSLSLCFNGILLATVSSSSNYLRVWNLFTGQKLQEVKMCSRRAKVTFCQISQDTRYICTISDDFVLSVFRIKLKSSVDNRGVRCMQDCKSFAGYLIKRMINTAKLYLDAPRAFARYKTKSPIIACTFLPNTNNILLVLKDRTVLRIGISGKLRLLAKHSL